MEFQGNIIKKTWEYGKKLSFGPDFVTFGPILDPQKIFQNIWLNQSLDIMVSYHHVQYQKKTNDPILRKLSDGQTHGQMDRQTGARVIS